MATQVSNLNALETGKKLNMGRKLIIGVIGFGLGRTARVTSAAAGSRGRRRPAPRGAAAVVVVVVAGRFSHGITAFTAIEMGTRGKPDGGDHIRATVGQPAPREVQAKGR